MAINIYWDRQANSVIRADFIGEWTWEEYDTIALEVRSMLLSVNERVDIIADMSKSDQTPQNPNGAQHVKRGRDLQPLNHGLMIVIDPDVFARATFSVGSIISAKRMSYIRYADTLKDAYHIVASDRKIRAQASVG